MHEVVFYVTKVVRAFVRDRTDVETIKDRIIAEGGVLQVELAKESEDELT